MIKTSSMPLCKFTRVIAIFLFLLPVLITSANVKLDSIFYFIPNPDVEKLAQEFDKNYFPLFLQSLYEIESSQFALIDELIYDERIIVVSPTILGPLEEMETNILPIYWNSIERIAYEVPFPIKWNNLDNSDPSWNMWFKSLRWLNPFLNSNDTDTVLMAFKVINDFIISHTKYPDALSRFSFHDQASAERLLIFITAYEIYINLPVSQPLFKKRLTTSILGHIFFLSTLEKYDSWNNHGIISDQYLINALIRAPFISDRYSFYDLAFARVFEQFLFGFTHEGIHKQHSPCYHFITKRRLDNVIVNADKLGYRIPNQITYLINDINSYQTFITSDSHALPIGDCGRVIIRNELGKIYNHGFKLFPASGWVFIRDSLLDISIITQSNFHSFAHYQQQETSFILNVAGHELIIDPGLLTYNRSSPYHEYMRSAKGHNVLLADCRSFDSRIENTGLAGITRYYQDPKNSISSNGIVEMTHPHYHDMGVEIHRQLAFAGNNVIIINDIITSDSVRTYTQQFHLAPGAEVKKERKHLIVQWEKHTYYIKISSNANEYIVVEGEMDPVQGWYFPAFNVAEPCPLLILKSQGFNHEFTTKIEVFEKDQYERASTGNKRKINRLIKNLNNLEKTKLKHEPFPQKWRPAR